MNQRRPVTPEAARLRMASLCARAEHCEYEIVEKLRAMRLASSDIADITAFLVREKFIDNGRYARSFARDKVRFSLWGRAKIRIHLLAKRIASADIAEALDAVEPADYAQALRKAAGAKAAGLDLSDMTDRQKLFRHLMQRGFESQPAADEVKRQSRLQNDESGDR